MNQSRPPTQTYVFGSSAAETERLQKLDPLLAGCTRRFLRKAGIDKGMKVLDVGCGPGAVSLLVADMVGRTGTVVGIDGNPAMLAAARARGRASGHRNVSFVEADLDGLELTTGFDAVVGRLILLHLRDPVAVVRKLTRHLRPGGIVAFQEPDLTRLGASAPPIPLVEQLCDWVRQAHQRLGVDTQFGLRLHQVFLDAGLPAPRLRCDTFVGAGPDWGWYAAILDAIRSALPVVVSAGIATAEEVELKTLAERLRDAIVSQRSATRGIDLVSAWTRTAPAQAARADSEGVPGKLLADTRQEDRLTPTR